jgi:sugar lactone lactonase YvrE
MRRIRDLLRALAVVCALLVAPALHSQTQATGVPLLLPSAIAFDAAGNLYIAETAAHLVRRIDTAGVVVTLAGTGVEGDAGDGGPATSARLDSPGGVGLDAAGNVFVADTHNHRIRRIAAATGTISTVAGTGMAGFAGDGGPATAALLDLPTALSVDAAGNLFIADTANHRIRKVTAAGVISTVAGTGVEGFSGDGGPATEAGIDSPHGLAVDTAGNLYLSDTGNGRIRRVAAATGILTTVAGGGVLGDGAAATSAAIALPRGITLDAAGNLYLAEAGSQRIRRIAVDGTITTVAGQGTQVFSGDGGPAVAASLDTPRAVAVSPGGLLTLADTGNARIRQLDALPAPGPDIHTLAGLDVGTAGALVLTGPAVNAYGSGTLTAQLDESPGGTGAVTLLDLVAGTAITIFQTTLQTNSATLSTASLAAGMHSLRAVYPGDPTHPAAESTAHALTVSPLTLAAAIAPATMLYGAAVPAFTGTLTGVLPQDLAAISLTLSAPVTQTSPVGAYPISCVLAGTAAANYLLPPTTGILTVAKAPTITTLTASTLQTSTGMPVVFTIHAASTTSGLPTGSITLLDGTAALATLALSTTGDATFTSALALGTQSITAVYSGDGNFLASASQTASIGIGVSPDFTLASSGPVSQAVPSGSAASFAFSVALVGTGLASPINLAVQGLPLGATGSLNPAYLPPGGAVTSFTLSVQTVKAGLDRPSTPMLPVPAAVLALLLSVLLLPCRKRGRPYLIGLALATALSVLTTGCGDRINSAAETSSGRFYSITVTGTATSPAGTLLQHSANVTLEVL